MFVAAFIPTGMMRGIFWGREDSQLQLMDSLGGALEASHRDTSLISGVFMAVRDTEYISANKTYLSKLCIHQLHKHVVHFSSANKLRQGLRRSSRKISGYSASLFDPTCSLARHPSFSIWVGTNPTVDPTAGSCILGGTRCK